MTITVPQNKSTDFVSGSQATLAVSFTSGISAGSIIAVAGSFSTAVSLSGVDDGKGDSFTTIFAPFTDGSTGSTNFFGVFLAPTTGATTITATYSGNATFGDLFIWEIAGLTNPTVDTAKVRTLTANGSTFASGSTGTLSASAAALITYAVSAQGIASFNTPWTLDSITAHTASGGAHEVVAANTAQTSTGSNTVSAIDVVYVVPFYSGAASAPFQPSDFPNPKPRPVPQENRGFIVDLNPALVGGGVKPFLQSDWPNPRGYVSYPENRTFTRPGNALIGGGVKPFAQTDWPNPKAYPRPTENRTFLFEGNALLLGIGAVQAPFRQLDWPNPRAYPVPQENRGFVQDLNPALYGGGLAPFAQTDWPNPKGYPVPQENRGFVKPLDLELVGGGVAPFTPYDWPNPKPRIVPAENRGLAWRNIAILAPAAVQAPFYQTDWPNPRGYPYPIGNRGFVSQVFNLPAPPVPPVVVVGGRVRVKSKKLWRTLPNGLRVQADDATYQTLLARYEGARKQKSVDEIVAALEPKPETVAPPVPVVAPPLPQAPEPQPVPFDAAHNLLEQRLAYQRALIAQEDHLILQLITGDQRPVHAAHIDDDDAVIIRLLLGDHPARRAPHSGDE